MQNDLISRSALLECFSITKDGHRIPERDCDNFEITVSIKDIKKIIKNQPIAYDVEKVVQQLEEMSFEDDCGGAVLLHDAEPIVRNGGKE